MSLHLFSPAWAGLPLHVVCARLAEMGLRLKSNLRGELVVVEVRHA